MLTTMFFFSDRYFFFEIGIVNLKGHVYKIEPIGPNEKTQFDHDAHVVFKVPESYLAANNINGIIIKSLFVQITSAVE
jgi:hypothetical protein